MMTQEQTDKKLNEKMRDERKEKRRQLVMVQFFRASLPLIKEKGLDLLSIEEITAAAGYSKGSLYNYFNSKEDFIIKFLDWGLDQFLEQISSTVHDQTLSYEERLLALRLTLQRAFEDGQELIFSHYLNNNRSSRIKLDCNDFIAARTRTREIRDLISNFFEEGMEAGIVYRMDAQRLTMAFIHTIVGLGIFESSHQDNDPEAAKLFYNQFFNQTIIKAPAQPSEENNSHE